MKIHAIIMLILLTGCSTIVSDSSYPVSLNSSPSGASVEVKNKKGHVVFSGVTPSQVELDSGRGYFSKEDYKVVFRKEGYHPHRDSITCSMDNWYWGNFLFGGLIGLFIVDPISGAMFELDQKSLHVNLENKGIE